MDVVELTLADGAPIFVNSARVSILKSGPDTSGGAVTLVVFEKDHEIAVKGDIDSIAFKLFPSGIR